MAVSIEMIKELRAATGAGVLDSKNALVSSGGDFDKAVRLLRERGIARVAKRAERETTEGRIEARTEGHQCGLLVEVNCETDFVGQNESFVAFVNDIADHFSAQASEGQAVEEVMALPFVKDNDTTPTELLQSQIASTGENMVVRRFASYELDDRPGMIEVYVHPGNRVAVMLELNSETAAGAGESSFGTLAHDLALHIAALAPLWLTREEIPAETQGEEEAAYRKQAVDEGKPEAIVDRIVEGRLRKWYENVVLFEQPFVKDDGVTVEELLRQGAAELGEGITLRRFVRFELGESLD